MIPVGQNSKIDMALMTGFRLKCTTISARDNTRIAMISKQEFNILALRDTKQ